MCEHFALVLTLAPILPRAKNDTIRHFCQLNGMTKLEFMNHYFDSTAEWEFLSSKKWSVNFGKFWPLIANKKSGSAFTLPPNIL